MKFDTLCNIILEGKKAQQFARIAVANASPVFSMEDVLRDPNDPSKGVRTYIDSKPKDVAPGEEADEEGMGRKALRRLNWVAKTAIKRTGSRQLDIGKLHKIVMSVVEQYLTHVMRYSDEQIAGMKLKIAKEAAFIGNLLLPASSRYPNAKGAFTIADDKIPGKKRIIKGTGEIADRLMKEFNMTVDQYIAAFDPDLLNTIKEIIRSGAIKKAAREEVEDGAVTEVPEGEITEEGVEQGEGVTIEDILKDPRIRNVYDTRIVRKVLKSMMDLGTVIPNAEGKLILPHPGEADWRAGFDKWKDKHDLENGDVEFPQEGETKELGDTLGETEPTDGDLGEIEDEERGEVSTDDKTAASRLGYKKDKTEEEETEDEDEDPSDEDGSWYK
jgi:hypothetical protein